MSENTYIVDVNYLENYLAFQREKTGREVIANQDEPTFWAGKPGLEFSNFMNLNKRRAI